MAPPTAGHPSSCSRQTSFTGWLVIATQPHASQETVITLPGYARARCPGGSKSQFRGRARHVGGQTSGQRLDVAGRGRLLEFFTGDQASSTALGATALARPEMMVEVEAVAVS